LVLDNGFHHKISSCEFFSNHIKGEGAAIYARDGSSSSNLIEIDSTAFKYHNGRSVIYAANSSLFTSHITVEDNHNSTALLATNATVEFSEIRRNRIGVACYIYPSGSGNIEIDSSSVYLNERDFFDQGCPGAKRCGWALPVEVPDVCVTCIRDACSQCDNGTLLCEDCEGVLFGTAQLHTVSCSTGPVTVCGDNLPNCNKAPANSGLNTLAKGIIGLIVGVIVLSVVIIVIVCVVVRKRKSRKKKEKESTNQHVYIEPEFE
jgi:hypothetical protein